MIRQPESQKRYHSARARFLRPVLARFFEQEFPRLLGPILRDRLIDELLKLFDRLVVSKDHLSPGQVLWNAVDRTTRPDSPRRKLVPVVLTLIDQQDCADLSNGTSMPALLPRCIARIMREAYAQGALLSMRDIELFTWRPTGGLTKHRRAYETEHKVTLPHTGTLQDMGSCITHKGTILRKLLIEKKDPRTIARETNHTLQAVERYLNDFRRVQHCYEKERSIDFIVTATALAKHVVLQYIDIIQELNLKSPRHLAQTEAHEPQAHK
ncbi:MAG: DUF1670 domain-containing protein [Bacteroidota bacterium]